MLKIKPSSFDGKFYPKSKNDLSEKIKELFEKSPHFYNYNSRAIIVPHAGYVYSGHVAANTFQYLDKQLKNIFIVSPAHYVDFKGIAITTHSHFSTPLGEAEVNQKINKEIERFEGVKYLDAAFEKEHAVEVQIPFIQTILPNAKIIPVICEHSSIEIVCEILSKYWEDSENGFIISSDLSHFYPQADAKKIDEYTANMIETQDVKNFHSAQACGNCGILGLVRFAKKNDFSLIRVQLTTSAELTGDDASVVGYGGWFLAEETKNSFLKNNFSQLAIDIVKNSIKTGIKTGTTPHSGFENFPPVFKEQGACFVTLELHNELRGCIGSVLAHRSLFEDLINNAFNAAFEDTRFLPLTSEEFDDLKISISLLSDPVEIRFSTEEELLEKITPHKDGIIIQDRSYSAVYLPSVWEQLSDKKEFLNSLRRKAGLNEKHFSKSFKAFRFTTNYIKEI